MKTPIVTVMRTQGARRRHERASQDLQLQIMLFLEPREDLMRSRQEMRRGFYSVLSAQSRKGAL